ncbi:dehydrogenase [Paenibacillus protaetiae]|uniref:Dehydrogenase n=1 Tax=Paenibacillus protaetiae TaxID=2509456 RepID=A0A4P6F4P5_9BACL|nr:dehydrogenase [Paenibacillus protaetiae]QAY68157.1 dehydrogenase [Paenibacillus protaetiae]
MSSHTPSPKHNTAAGYPTARKIRRACSNELYRTAKRLKLYVAPKQMEEAERYYFKKVAENLLYIHEHQSNRKLLADWWETNVSEEIARLWNVDAVKLNAAFREAFGAA